MVGPLLVYSKLTLIMLVEFPSIFLAYPNKDSPAQMQQ